MKSRETPGALVLSLDFELHWGVRERHPADGAYRKNLLGAREVIPRLLHLFEQYGVAVTWATVGFLFAGSREELKNASPALKPLYDDPVLSPYKEPVGVDEEDDPVHFAPSLIAMIRETPHQEIGTHTFSHYYCLAPGQNRETFEADLHSAVAIAGRRGVHYRSIVFPRNQFNPVYGDLLHRAGILCYRGNQPGWMYTAEAAESRLKRAVRRWESRLLLFGTHLARWEDVVGQDGLCNIPASAPVLGYDPAWSRWEGIRFRRLASVVRAAAEQRKIAHLWWHPHDFGAHPDRNIGFLTRLLDVFVECRERFGMQSLHMAGAAEKALSLSQSTHVVSNTHPHASDA